MTESALRAGAYRFHRGVPFPVSVVTARGDRLTPALRLPSGKARVGRAARTVDNAFQEGRLDFRMLGPFGATADAGPFTLTGGKQKALLALLLLHADRVVPMDRLIDDLWGLR